MPHTFKLTLSQVLFLGLVLFIAGCDTTVLQTPDEASVSSYHPVRTAAVSKTGLDSDVPRQLAELRRATARFHRLDDAKQIKYEVDITGCLENPPQGGMGHHYGNPPFDDQLDVTDPEALLFEPGPNGEMRLVGVEYIATGDENDVPPTLMGQTFAWNSYSTSGHCTPGSGKTNRMVCSQPGIRWFPASTLQTDWPRAILLIALFSGPASCPRVSNQQATRNTMPKYLIRRNIKNAGDMNREQLEGAARTSCDVLSKLGPEVQWVQSYVTGNTIHCVYIAPDEGQLRIHADRAGFPADEIMKIRTTIDPTTAEQDAASEA